MNIIDNNILFLDIDGVLNTERYIIEQNKDNIVEMPDYNFDPVCMRYLKKLITEYNLKIVLTTSWRNTGHEKYIFKNFSKYQLPTDTIIDRVDWNNKTRGEQIEDWLKVNRVNNYIVLDDEDFDLGNIRDNLVLCNQYNGFDKEQYNECIEKLKYWEDK